MKKLMTRAGMVASVGAGVLVLAPVASAQAAYVGGYNRTSTSVANTIGCQNLRGQDSGGTVKTTLVCDLHGKRVNVITFSSESQQTRWLGMVDAAFPRGGYVGVGRGVVIVAYDGNRSAASTGAAAVNGAVVPVG